MATCTQEAQDLIYNLQIQEIVRGFAKGSIDLYPIKVAPLLSINFIWFSILYEIQKYASNVLLFFFWSLDLSVKGFNTVILSSGLR